MDNKVGSQIKRALRVTGDYFVSLVIFGIFSSIVFSIAKENIERGIYVFSIIIFLIMFSMIYSSMSGIAFKEKRPQYNINPSPYKGFFVWYYRGCSYFCCSITILPGRYSSIYSQRALYGKKAYSSGIYRPALLAGKIDIV
jgi:hypothetical protein